MLVCKTIRLLTSEGIGLGAKGRGLLSITLLDLHEKRDELLKIGECQQNEQPYDCVTYPTRSCRYVA